jgi:uncharacterized protein (TIGR02996 family)
MTHDAFLRAIIERPDDDLPRLVYADYLDEVGDHARAEFIRVQCELAALPEDDPRRPALEDREHELLAEHEPAWLGDTGKLAEWAFRRGFLYSITTAGFELLDSEVRLFSAHPITNWAYQPTMPEYTTPQDLLAAAWVGRIRSIDVSAGGSRILDWATVLASTDHVPSLRELDLSNNPGIGELAELLYHSPVTKQLSSFAFGGRSGVNFRWGDAENETLDVARFNEALAGTRLEQLSAFDCGLTSDGLRWLLAAPYSAHLKSLDVSSNHIGPDAWRAFHHCPTGMRLDRLDVAGTSLAGISLERLLEAPALEQLTRLDMSRCGSARMNMEVVAKSGFWSRAVEFRVRQGTVPASTLEPLCQSPGSPALRVLDLGDNYLRTEGVRLLCEAPWAGGLTYLSLSRNYLDDESVEALARSGRFPRLRTLHLAYNNLDLDRGEGEEITHRGAVALAAAPSLANLRVLSLSYTGVTDRSVELLLDAPHWRLFGLGLAGCDLSPAAVRVLAGSPRLARLRWLDLSGNPRLSGSALLPLAESPYLSRLCELHVGNVYADERTRQALRGRLGPRLGE